MLKLAVAIAPTLSVTLATNGKGPVVVGVPEITPPGLRDTPFGSVPELSDQVYGVVPPVAESVVGVIALLTVAGGITAGEMLGGGMTVIE